MVKSIKKVKKEGNKLLLLYAKNVTQSFKTSILFHAYIPEWYKWYDETGTPYTFTHISLRLNSEIIELTQRTLLLKSRGIIVN